MLRIFSYRADGGAAGQSVGAFLRALGFSHRTLARIKRLPGGITLGGESVPASALLHEGDLLTVRLEEGASPGVEEWDHPLDILYEDEDILVINKPAGIPAPPSAGHRTVCMAGAVLHHYARQGVPFTVRLVSRLDADTSGALLIAKNMHAASLLGDMQKSHRIGKLYLGFAEGKIAEPALISAPIARQEGSALARCVDPAAGEEAMTFLSPLCYDAETDLTLVRFRLLTGRTHQIRVHMQYLGHPLTGDFLYPSRRDRIARQALHAAALSFVHPVKKEAVQIYAPLPDDLRALLPAGVSSDVRALLGGGDPSADPFRETDLLLDLAQGL